MNAAVSLSPWATTTGAAGSTSNGTEHSRAVARLSPNASFT